MANTTPSPPGDPATLPDRTLPIRHRQARNNQPEGPDYRRDRNREDGADATVGDGHSTHRPDVEAEPAVHPCQLSRVPRQPLHDPQTGTAEVHPAVSPAKNCCIYCWTSWRRRTSTLFSHSTRPMS